MHLLDDGFQHRGLARAVDVVLVTEEDLEDALLPAGNRREPLAALGRADVVVLREEERERVEARVRGLMRAGAAVWSVRRELRCCEGAGRGAEAAGVLRDCAAGGVLGDAGGGGLRVGGESGVRRSSCVCDGRYGADGCDGKGVRRDGIYYHGEGRGEADGAMMERLREVGPVCVAGLTARFVDEADVVRELEARLR